MAQGRTGNLVQGSKFKVFLSHQTLNLELGHVQNDAPRLRSQYNCVMQSGRGVVVNQMSAVVKAGHSGQKPSRATIVLVALGFTVVVFFLVTYGQQVLMEHSLKDKASAQRAANNALSDENTRLKASLLYYQSDKYIEQRAREDLNLRRPEEEIIIPIRVTPNPTDGKPKAVEAPIVTQPARPVNDEKAPNWEKWLNLFSPD